MARKRNQIGKKLFFLLLCVIVVTYCFYSEMISDFYVKYTIQIKLVSFLFVVFIFLFFPINFGKMYKLSNNIGDFDSKSNYFTRMKDQMDVLERASRLVNGEIAVKRNVNGYKKRLIAAKQNWKCGNCKNLLDPAFEVDHIIALSEGGTNNDDNLVCLCRNCHGLKTFRERAK